MMFNATARGMSLATEYSMAYRAKDGVSQSEAKR
jgi:hypothetical protein